MILYCLLFVYTAQVIDPIDFAYVSLGDITAKLIKIYYKR